jgi:Bacteriophage protein gp37
MATSSIEWTNATWNPVAVCSNRYAMRMAKYAGGFFGRREAFGK